MTRPTNRQVSGYVPPDWYPHIEQLAAKNGETISRWLTTVVRAEMERSLPAKVRRKLSPPLPARARGAK